jgi:hypothetical protein
MKTLIDFIKNLKHFINFTEIMNTMAMIVDL